MNYLKNVFENLKYLVSYKDRPLDIVIACNNLVKPIINYTDATMEKRI